MCPLAFNVFGRMASCLRLSAIKPPYYQEIYRKTPTRTDVFGHPGMIRVRTDRNYILTTQNRNFHTSPRRDVPPIVWMIVKPLARVASIVGGRTFRKWWQRLTPEKRQFYKEHFLKRKSVIVASVGFMTIASALHYFTHLQSTPVTNRRRYVAFTPKQFLKIAQFECDMEFEQVQDKIVPPTHPVYKTVTDVTQRIVNANQDLEFLRDHTWIVVVIDSKEANAAVLPTGHVFVNTGLLQVTQNEDQLAVVLGHELAHALLGHGAEKLSFATVLDVIVVVVLAAIWAFMPTDGFAIVTEWFYNKVVQILLHLPYSRKLELEADEVGLQLITKACYDVRESSVFWSAMTIHNELEDNFEIPELISTHPANEFRAQKLDQLIPKAIQQRQSCNCPELSAKDPRSRLAMLQQLADEKRKSIQSTNKKDDELPTVKLPSNASPENQRIKH